MHSASQFHSTRHTDGGGFEPPVPFGTHAFQACTINHSVTHPEQSSFSSESYSRFGEACTPRLRGRKSIRVASVGTIRRAAIECRCKIRRSPRTQRSLDRIAFCKRLL